MFSWEGQFTYPCSLYRNTSNTFYFIAYSWKYSSSGPSLASTKYVGKEWKRNTQMITCSEVRSLKNFKDFG